MKLLSNRYGQTVPTSTNDKGTVISVPFYLQPTPDQKKALLNAFRVIKQKQLLDMGWSEHRSEGSLVVVDHKTPPQTPIEQELGNTEETLRLQLFSRQGLQERWLLKLCRLTGIELVTRQEIEETFNAWMDHLYPTTEEHHDTTETPKKIKRTRKTSKTVES